MVESIIFINNPNELLKFKSNQKYSFNCKHCGLQCTRMYFKYDYEKQKRLLCTICSRIDSNIKICGHKYFVTTNEFKEKSKNTNLKNLGVEYPGQCKKCRQKSVKTYAKKHNIEYDENYQSLFSLKEIQEKSSIKINELYGSDWYTQTNGFKEQSKQTKLEKYGDENYSNREKATQTNIEKYGVDNVMKCKEIGDKSRKTTFERYGFSGPPNYKYQYYDGEKFDSSWELALWIYAKDHNESIIREPCEFKFKYGIKDDNKVVPDFLYNGKLIEIKGDHYFKDGKMICVKKRPEWSVEKCEYMDGLYEAKHQCELDNNVEFWCKKEIEPYVKYVEDKYGIDYLPSFKVVKIPKDKYSCIKQGV